MVIQIPQQAADVAQPDAGKGWLKLAMGTWAEATVGKFSFYQNHIPSWFHYKNCCLVARLCLTLLCPMDYSPQGSTIHGILQARILEWIAISFSRGSCQPRDQTCVSYVERWILFCWATREAPIIGIAWNHFIFMTPAVQVLVRGPFVQCTWGETALNSFSFMAYGVHGPKLAVGWPTGNKGHVILNMPP